MKPFTEFNENYERKLSPGIPFVLVALYLVDGSIFFGELTSFHDVDIVPLDHGEWENILGDWIQLPEKIL